MRWGAVARRGAEERHVAAPGGGVLRVANRSWSVTPCGPENPPRQMR